MYFLSQSKERLIASLREGSGASGEAAGVSSLEYDTVKQERDMFKEEIQQARMTIENLRVELAVSRTVTQNFSSLFVLNVVMFCSSISVFVTLVDNKFS